MTRSRRSVLALGAALAVGPLAGACASQGAEQATSAPIDTQAKHDITFWPRSTTDKIAFDAMLPIAKQQFPNLTVTFEIPAGAMMDKLNVAIAADTPPDGIVMGLEFMKFEVNRKAVLSLQDYLK